MVSNEISRNKSGLKDCDLTGRLLGDYRIERRIGAGAMAEVWLARQRSLDRLVALKVLRPELVSDETYVRRFVHEAKSAAKLEHPNIVHIYDVGSFSDHGIARRGILHSICNVVTWPWRLLVGSKQSRPLYYISEEYVDGLNLQQYLRQRGPLSISQAFFVMLSIASALEKAASMDIVHRDIKPENILLSSAGIVKIADFGLARRDSSDEDQDVTLTQIGMTLGTPLYMSPEQSQGKNLDFRSDIYSFGVTAWQILTGKTP
ncbi:MAG: serine/threonine-protein kinase, partial [Planctomycetia bacterium]|nr:serine/threonine-protein kinase [Planctomycetia bacterium]